MTYTTESKKDFENVSPESWLIGDTKVLPILNETGWYIFNLQSIGSARFIYYLFKTSDDMYNTYESNVLGFFRVNYDEDNWNALTKQLYNDPNAIHVLNRAQLIDDAFNLARVEKLNYTFVLDLTEYLEKETDLIPWYSAKNGFSYLTDRMRRCPHSYIYLKVD